jgi:hypothetical protein
MDQSGFKTGDPTGHAQDFLGQCFQPLPTGETLLPMPLMRLLNLAAPLPPGVCGKRGLDEGIDLRGHGQLWASVQVGVMS